MSEKKLVGVTLTKNYDDGSTEPWTKVPIGAVAAMVTAGLSTGQGNQRTSYRVNADECPVHGDPWSIRERRDNGVKFYTCSNRDDDDEWCKYKPSRAWQETHPIDKPGIDQQPPPEPTSGAPDAGEFDDLPF
jgi:hypothetical protein